MRPVVTDYSDSNNGPRGLSVCLSVCLSVTIVSPAKTAEPIEIPFGLWTRVGPKNHVLDGGLDPRWEGAVLRGRPIHVWWLFVKLL